MTLNPIAARLTSFSIIVSSTTMLLVGMAPPVWADGSIRTVVLSGDALPGVPADVVFSSSTIFRMNNRGQVLFTGALSGPSIINEGLNGAGLWLDTPGRGLEFIVRNGQQAPGSLDGINFRDLNLEIPELNDAGQVQIKSFIYDSTGAMRVSNSHPGTNNFGDWIWRPGLGIARLAVGEDPTPSLNHSFRSIDGSSINNLGQLVRGAQITPALGGFTDSLWLVEADAEPRLIAGRGAPAPGLTSGIVFGVFQQGKVNNAGQIVYQSTLSGPGVNSANDEALWLDDGTGVVELIARDGNQAPGLPMGVVYDFATGRSEVTDAGRVVLSRVLRGPGVNSGNNFAWWSGASADSLNLIAREGNLAPGTSAGVEFDILNLGGSATNAPGQLAVAGSLRGEGVHSGNDVGVWSQRGNTGLELIAREGDPAPGAEPNVVFNLSFAPDNPFFAGSMSLNDVGQLVITVGMTGPGITAANDRGIWAQDRHGVLQLIAREGQQLDVGDGPGTDLRIIESLSYSTPPTINNLGQVVFRAAFTDGSKGIFVSNLVAIPEPGTWPLLASGAAVIVLRRTRTRACRPRSYMRGTLSFGMSAEASFESLQVSLSQVRRR